MCAIGRGNQYFFQNSPDQWKFELKERKKFFWTKDLSCGCGWLRSGWFCRNFGAICDASSMYHLASNYVRAGYQRIFSKKKVSPLELKPKKKLNKHRKRTIVLTYKKSAAMIAPWIKNTETLMGIKIWRHAITGKWFFSLNHWMQSSVCQLFRNQEK